MKKKRKLSFVDFFEIIMYIISLICFIYFLIEGNIIKAIQSILVVLILCALRLVIKNTKVKVSTYLRFAILVFIFVAMILASEFDFYSKIPYLDKMEHLTSGVLFNIIGAVIFDYINRNEEYISINPLTKILFCLFFSIAIAGVWEIFEFTVDNLLGLNCQNGSLVDTMGDIICGTTGAICTSIYLYLKAKRQRKEENNDITNI